MVNLLDVMRGDMTPKQVAMEYFNLPIDFEGEPTHSPKLAFKWLPPKREESTKSETIVESTSEGREASKKMCK